MVDVCSEQLDACAKSENLPTCEDICMNEASSFIHRFQTELHMYIYDVNTRRIIRVSPVVWDVLEYYGTVQDDEIVAKLSESYSEELIRAAVTEIATTRGDKGLLLSIRPQKLRLPKIEDIQKRLDGMRDQLILDVTEDCNFRCSYCVFGKMYDEFRDHTFQSMTWDVAKLAIDDFLAHSRLSESRMISFYGGEPLLNFPLIMQAVQYAKEVGDGLDIFFSLTTNGLLLRGEIADFLAKEGFMVSVSLDGPADIHDRHRRTKDGEPTWQQVTFNVRNFVEAHPEYKTNNLLRFNAVATRTTNLCEAQRFWSSSDVFTDCMGFSLSQQKTIAAKPVPLKPEDPLASSSREIYAEFLKSVFDGKFADSRKQTSQWLAQSIFERPFVSFHKRGFLTPHLPEQMTYLNHCIPGERRTFVSANGDYYACERVCRSEAQKIGDVANGINTEKVVTILQRWLDASREECRNCWCLPTCSVGCLATIGNNGEITADAKREACMKHRQNMHQTLMDYCSVLESNPNAFGYAAEFTFK